MAYGIIEDSRNCNRCLLQITTIVRMVSQKAGMLKCPLFLENGTLHFLSAKEDRFPFHFLLGKKDSCTFQGTFPVQFSVKKSTASSTGFGLKSVEVIVFLKVLT